MDSLFELFKVSEGVQIMLKAHHPSWIYKEFGEKRNSQDTNFKILFESTSEYYQKKEYCVIISAL